MEWWAHALYALAIVVVALIGWRVWRKERHKSICYRKDRSNMARSNADLTRWQSNAYARIEWLCDQISDKNQRMAALVREINEAESRAQSAEQSNRALRGHNKRYRERIAELEGE